MGLKIETEALITATHEHVPKMSTNNYLKRHYNVAAIVHRNICQHYGVKSSKTPWKCHQLPVAENKEVKVSWDFEIQTDKVIPAQRPDIVVIDKAKCTTTIIDIAVPLDWKVKDKEDEILKYLGLRMKIQKL